MFRQTILRWYVGLAVLSLTSQSQAQDRPAALTPTQAAIRDAARQRRYSFVVFWHEQDASTQAMRLAVQIFSSTTGGVTVHSVPTTDPAERPLVDQFGVSGAPLPLLLAIAPNGGSRRTSIK